jgi:RHS repeat-associated protein
MFSIRFMWDATGGKVIAEYNDASGAVSWAKSYVYLGERLLATESTTIALQFHHPDRLGTRLVTNASDGTSAGEQETLPFGTALGAGISGNQRRFTSYDRSTTTKLDYAVNRTYNAGLGRFTQVDPIGMAAVSLTNPQSLNLDAYCFNDPINHTDPDGLDGGVTFVVIQVVSAVIGLFRAIFGSGKRARTAPIIRQVTARRQGQLTQRTIWTEAGIRAGVGAVSTFIAGDDPSDVIDLSDVVILTITTTEYGSWWDNAVEKAQNYAHSVFVNTLDGAASLSAGFGDGWTTIPFTDLCGTCAIRRYFGSTDVEEKSLQDSSLYSVGQVSGELTRDALLTAGTAKIAKGAEVVFYRYPRACY